MLTTGQEVLSGAHRATGRRAGVAGYLVRSVLLCALAAIGLALHAAQVAAAVRLEPVQDVDLNRTLQNAFVLPMMSNRLAGTGVETSRLLEAEVRRLKDLLQSIGYLDAEINVLSGPHSGDDVRLLPVPGDLFRIGWVGLAGLPEELPPDTVDDLENFAATFAGLDVTRDNLDRMEAGLVWRLRDAAYAHAQIVQTEKKTEPDLKTAGVIITVDPGPAVRIGGIRFLGSKHTDILLPLAGFVVKEGGRYSASAMEQLRALLEKTDLFSRIEITLAKPDEVTGFTDLEIDLVEKPAEARPLDFQTRVGPALAIFTMLLILLRECMAGTRWSRKPFEPAFALTVTVFYAINVAVVFNLVASAVIQRG